jgi:hypothetical protein
MTVLQLQAHAIDPEAAYQQWVDRFLWHVDQLPLLVEKTGFLVIPTLRAARLQEKVSGGGYVDNLPIVDGPGARDTIAVWAALRAYVASASSHLGVKAPEVPASVPDDVDVARHYAYAANGWLASIVYEIRVWPDLAALEEELFRLIRRARGRASGADTVRRAKPELCDVCGRHGCSSTGRATRTGTRPWSRRAPSAGKPTLNRRGNGLAVLGLASVYVSVERVEIYAGRILFPSSQGCQRLDCTLRGLFYICANTRLTDLVSNQLDDFPATSNHPADRGRIFCGRVQTHTSDEPYKLAIGRRLGTVFAINQLREHRAEGSVESATASGFRFRLSFGAIGAPENEGDGHGHHDGESSDDQIEHVERVRSRFKDVHKAEEDTPQGLIATHTPHSIYTNVASKNRDNCSDH